MRAICRLSKSDIAPTFVSLRLMRPEDILDIHLLRMDHTLFNLCLSYPVSWVVSFSAHIICFIIFYRAWRDRTAEKHRLSRIVLNASR